IDAVLLGGSLELRARHPPAHAGAVAELPVALREPGEIGQPLRDDGAIFELQHRGTSDPMIHSGPIKVRPSTRGDVRPCNHRSYKMAEKGASDAHGPADYSGRRLHR